MIGDVMRVSPQAIITAQPTARKDYQTTFRECLEKMWEITSKKNSDYANEEDPFRNFREFGELGFLVRMSDKFARLKSAIVEKKDMQVSDETVEDTLLDLANYAVLLICWRRAEGKKDDFMKHPETKELDSYGYGWVTVKDGRHHINCPCWKTGKFFWAGEGKCGAHQYMPT
jgi:hypothetical protein